MMKTKIMLMIVVAFKSQNQFCWNLRIFDGGKLAIICVSGGKITCLLVMVIMVIGDPDDNGDDGVHHDGSNLIL